jgi:penicillin-binding protein 2
MRRVVNVQGGTAYASRLSTGFEFSGKTGTAQVISKRHLEAIKHLSDDEKKKRQHHGLFFGFGPVASPRYAVGVVVENGGSGSGAAAPVAKRAFQALQEVAEGRDPLLLLQEPTEEKKV